MRTALTLLLFVMTGSLASTAAADPEAEARAAMDETVAAVIDALADESVPFETRRERVVGIAYDRFDFETMSKLVLKRGWRKFSDEQKTQFVESFRTYLAESYGSRLTRYNQEAVEMAGERLEPRGDVTVLTRIDGGEADGVEVNYRLRNRDGGGWRIIDVVIEGISLVSNFSSQFSDVLQKGGPAEVLARLEAKNLETAEKKAAEAEDAPSRAPAAGAAGTVSGGDPRREPAAKAPPRPGGGRADA